MPSREPQPGEAPGAGVAAFRACWTLAGVALTAGAVLLDGRGGKRAPAASPARAGLVGLGALIAFVALGCSLAGRLRVP